ncbi:YibE/F family protein [Nocardioides currus]|uniref:YibE/F family protein n=1 Tax=Nocardioides currus TaxID=2133958 RepID=A0A2R7YRQ9_9ACTN|nr:YibE/F family protein [Nocardioides currus]
MTRLLLGLLALTAIATLVGVVVLWPDGERPTTPYSADGVTYPDGEVLRVGEACPVVTQDSTDFPEICDDVDVRLDDAGTVDGVRVRPGVVDVLQVGDRVTLVAVPQQGADEPSYGWVGVDRKPPLGWLALVFLLVVAVIARVRGLLAILGLGFAGTVIGWFMLPALLAGSSGLAVALVGSTAIMFVVLYLAHGPSVRTSTALAGTLIGLAITAGVGLVAIHTARLSGLGDESSLLLRNQADQLDFRGLLTCAVIVAGLGVLNDVTITQSSSVWELRQAAPHLSRRAIFTSGMRIGRDHIASTIYTIVFAYAGTAVATMLLISLYDRPLIDVLSDEAIAEEVARTLASAIGLVLAVPVTTAIAAATVAPAVRPDGSLSDERAGSV